MKQKQNEIKELQALVLNFLFEGSCYITIFIWRYRGHNKLD